MLRIPNPSSDIAILLRIFQQMYGLIVDRQPFTMDDLREQYGRSHLVSSRGAAGEQALQRSEEEDKSLDPMFNQAKMYSEVYRTFGWINSTSLKRIEAFSFTFLGDHIASVSDPWPLFRECLLGMSYPNELVKVKGDPTIRPFALLLWLMARLGGLLVRDEMIVALSLPNDTDQGEMKTLVERLRSFRKKPGQLEAEVERIGKQRKIQINTLQNYTRIPISALVKAGWAVKLEKNATFKGRSVGAVLRLTDDGADTVQWLESVQDIRLSSFRRLSPETQSSLSRWTFYRMLERAGFDMRPVKEEITRDVAALRKQGFAKGGEILFSVFQQVSHASIKSVCPDLVAEAVAVEGQESEGETQDIESAMERSGARRSLVLVEMGKAVAGLDEMEAQARELIDAFEAAGGNKRQAVKGLKEKYRITNQSMFYPLVERLLRLVGYDCRLSRQGDTNQRFDALIIDVADSMPIEIKSPAEEEEISVKAIRQALENKVVLRARTDYQNEWETTSLVIGYHLPRARSDVHELIEDIHTAYGLNVGVIDFVALLRAALHAAITGKKVAIEGLARLKGVLDANGS